MATFQDPSCCTNIILGRFNHSTKTNMSDEIVRIIRDNKTLGAIQAILTQDQKEEWQQFLLDRDFVRVYDGVYSSRHQNELSMYVYVINREQSPNLRILGKRVKRND